MHPMIKREEKVQGETCPQRAAVGDKKKKKKKRRMRG
jgi:hypothetical protein